jgi:hypothetical protein
MESRGTVEVRDTLWAWAALVIAVVLALVVAPLDRATSQVRLDGARSGEVSDAADGQGGATGLFADLEEGAEGASFEGEDFEVADAGDGLGDGAPLEGDLGFEDPGADPVGGDGVAAAPGGPPPSGGDADAAPPGGAPEDASSQGAAPAAGAQQPGQPAGVAGGETGRGVTAEEVRVGFIILRGQEESANDLGFGGALPAAGNPEKQIADLTAWVNANGGIGGRRLVPRLRAVDMRTSSTQDEQRVCTAFTQDDEVFAAVLVAQIRESTRVCYADAKTLALDAGGFPMSGPLYEQTAPYLWSPNNPTLSETSRVLPRVLQQQGFFQPNARDDDPCLVAPCRVGVVMYDFANYNQVLERDLKPALRAAGVTLDDADVMRVNASDAATIQSGLTNATLRFQSRGVHRVLFLGGAPLAPFFMVIAEQQRFRPVYGLTTFDSPRFGSDNRNMTGSQIFGARGLGFMPAADVRDQQHPQRTAMEQQCLQIYEAAGHRWEQRGDYRIAVAYCESVLMLKHVADRIAPNLTPERWAAGAAQLGDSFQTATPLRARFSQGNRAGAAAYRPLRFDMRCECMVYDGSMSAF